MSLVDLAVIATIAIIAGYPAIGAAVSAIRGLRTPSVLESSKAEWRQQWVKTLISLQTELEEASEDSQAELCRQLIWEILGGDPEEVAA